jgi:hypothetical protein
MCDNCPFANDGKGRFLRSTLRPGRWREILASLRRGEHFHCHQTTEETGNGSKLVCAGSIEWQNSRGIVSEIQKIGERLAWWAERNKGELHG